MMSWRVEDLVTRETSDALGAEPAGYLTYTPDGRVMVLVLRRGRKPPSSLLPTDAEKADLYDTIFAYAGTFSVDHEKVAHRIDMSWNEAWSGTDQIRFFSLKGETLTYVGAPARSPMNGRDCVHTVVFRRSH